MEKNAKIYVAGHRGMVGSAIVRNLRAAGYDNLLTRTSKELDLRQQQLVHDFFAEERPDYVFLAAAKVGGILANNTYRGEFLYDNLMIEANIIEAARVFEVKKLLFLGSSCIYPKLAAQPLTEDALLTGPLEPTNEPYAIAKITGIKLCDAYRHHNLETSHVLPALIRKFHTAKKDGTPEVVMWGTGSPKREFLHADDLADACVFLMHNFSDYGFVNIGTGEDLAILELARTIKDVVGYPGEITHDLTKPDGTPRKLMNVDKLHAMGWRHTLGLREGIEQVYAGLAGEEWW